jgi:hypothetical protein
LFRLLFAAATPADYSAEPLPETDSEKADRLAVEQGENEGMTVHDG